MLTKWKKFSTSLEIPPQTSPNGALNHSEGSARKKKEKYRKSLTHNQSSISSSGIAASFVQPLACDDPSYQERVNSTAENSKKRRKSHRGKAEGLGKDGSHGNHHDVEPILCITSPHRVVFMGRKNVGAKGLDGVGVSLIESKTNSYVARPGTGSQFFIRDTEVGCFSGMVPAGAQYDPSSNFTYALRQGGAELAVWSAVPSSVLTGPDDELPGSMRNGINNNQAKNADATRDNNEKKRKTLGYVNDFVSSDDEISIHHLQFPTGKKALSLTPFHIPKSNDSTATLAFGAAGCCEDGSVWVASRHSKSSSQFELTVVNDFIVKNAVENGDRKISRKMKSTEAKSTLSEENIGWKVIESNVVGACPIDEKRGSMTNCNAEFVLLVQSVVISEQRSEVQCRHFQLRVGVGKDNHNRQTNESKDSPSYLVEKMTHQKILTLQENSDTKVAAKISADGKSLSIVHGQRERGWMFTSVALSIESGAVANSISSFPIPGCVPGGRVDLVNSATVLSFGRLGGNIFAILTKLSGSSDLLYSLSIVDVRKKAELFTSVWSEGCHIDGVDATSKKGPLAKLLQDKRCVAMITNELDGSISLFASPHNGKGTLDIICSKFDGNGSSHRQALAEGTLASALRVVASSSVMISKQGITLDAAKPAPIRNLTIPGIVEIAELNQSMDLNSLNAACLLITDASSKLIDFFTNAECNSQREENGNIGTSIPISWSASYHQGLNILSRVHTSSKAMKKDVPIEFIESAFKSSITILLSLKNPLEMSNLKKKVHAALQEVTSVLLEVIKSGHVSARKDYGFGSKYKGNIFLSMLRACPSGISNLESIRMEIISAMLEHIRDIPEQLLVSILRFVLRYVETDDFVTYYSKESVSGKTSLVARLSKQYMELIAKVPHKADSQQYVDEEKNLASRIMSLAVLDITSKIITYSRCNHSFLTKAMRDGLKSNAEVETLLITLSKLLQCGGGHDAMVSFKGGTTLSVGAVEWISALTDAHLGTMLKISLGGGLVIDRIQSAVRSALAQSEFSNEAKEMLDHIEMVTEHADTMTDESSPSLRETTVLYSTERLAF